MDKIIPTKLMDAYHQISTIIKTTESQSDFFSPTACIFEEKKKHPDTAIMVYGVYNAGKSTLINVLIGREVAATDDIPLTDRVTSYRWENHDILDTPGVDAPIEHEQVTKTQMIKADAVIFVVDPVGTAEEIKTLSVLLDLIQERKQVFLVFNEKKPISEEDFIRLKDQTRLQLQVMAKDRHLGEILKKIPISKINAKRALQGILKNQPKLVELSGYPSFERQLKEFLNSISSDDVYGRLKAQLASFCREYISIVQSRTQADTIKGYDRLLHRVSAEKSQVQTHMEQNISRHTSNIYEKVKILIRSDPERCQPQIEKLLQISGQAISCDLSTECQNFIASVQNEVEALQTDIKKLSSTTTPVKVPLFEGDLSSEKNEGELKIDSSVMNGVINHITGLAKPEHIVNSLKIVKDVFPSLMKGIGIKTMEKWASLAVTKWIPYVGPVISLVGLVRDLFSEDSESERIRKQTEEQQRHRERVLQQIEDFAREISMGFGDSMRSAIQTELDSFFSGVVTQLDTLRQGFSETEQANSRLLEKLLEIEQRVLAA